MSVSEELLPPPFAEVEELPTQFDGPLVKTPEKASSESKATDSPKERSLPPLPNDWIATTKSKREIPHAAKVAGGGIMLLLMLVFFAPECGSNAETTKSSVITDTEVEAAEYLRKRRHLSDVDFAVASPVHRKAPPAPRYAEPIDISERQRLRSDNPEDIRTEKFKHKRQRVRLSPQASSPRYGKIREEDDILEFYNDEIYRPSPEKVGEPRRRAKSQTLLAAATKVNIQLTSDLTIRNGRTTVIAMVGAAQKLPKGTKLIGSASADRDGLVSIRFRTVVMPTGESLRARAEAIDESGAMALLGTVSGGSKSNERPSTARTVGSSTAQSAASTALGGGLLGRAVDQTMSETRRGSSSPTRNPTVVRLSGDTPLFALFLDELKIESSR